MQGDLNARILVFIILDGTTCFFPSDLTWYFIVVFENKPHFSGEELNILFNRKCDQKLRNLTFILM